MNYGDSDSKMFSLTTNCEFDISEIELIQYGWQPGRFY